GLNRSTFHRVPATGSEEDLRLMRLIDEQYLKTPFYGSRRMTVFLGTDVKIIAWAAVLPSAGSDVPPGCGGRKCGCQEVSSVPVEHCTSWRGPSAIDRSTPSPAVPSTAL